MVWNAEGVEYEEERNPDPQQFVKDTNRWSYHLGADPYGGQVGAWAKQYYDNPNIDPNSVIQSQLGAFRRRYGSDAPEDDLSALEYIATGRTPPTKQQTPTQQWLDAAPVAPGTPAAGAPASPVTGTATTTRDPRSDELYKLLMERARQGTTIGREDANVRAQVDPFAAQIERAQRNYIDDMAEGARGVPLNLTGERRMAAERAGQQVGQLEAQTIGREIEGRRQEIAQSLALAGGLLSDEQRLELQRELGLLEDATRRYGMGLEQDRFGRELALKDWQAKSAEDQFMRELALREWDTRQGWDYRFGQV
jgi:hypothetical protein